MNGGASRVAAIPGENLVAEQKIARSGRKFDPDEADSRGPCESQNGDGCGNIIGLGAVDRDGIRDVIVEGLLLVGRQSEFMTLPMKNPELLT